MIRTIYNSTNKTMWILGKQYALTVTEAAEIRQGLYDIQRAYNLPNISISFIIDIFMWGYIQGKRAERAKRKGV